MSLESILNEINKNKEVASTNLENIAMNVRAGTEMAIREAKDNVARLSSEYLLEAKKNAIGIFVIGTTEQEEKFAEVARQEGDTITVSANSLYERLAAPVNSALGASREFSPNSMRILATELNAVAFDLGIARMNSLSYSEAFLPDPKAVTAHIKNMVRKALGDDLNMLYISKTLMKTLMEQNYGGSSVPSVVLGATEEEASALGKLFGKGSVVVALRDTDEITSEFVLKNFQNTTKKLKRTK